jgi:hypothetical protein
LENARLAGEIRELQTALKESEAARRDAEARAQRVSYCVVTNQYLALKTSLHFLLKQIVLT